MLSCRSHLIIRLAPLLGLALIASPLRAQARLSATVDAGVSASRGSGGSFTERGLLGTRLAGSVRFAAARAGIFVDVADETWGYLAGGDKMCVIGGDGRCVPKFPGMHGWSTAVGLVLRPAHFVEARIGVGPGRFASNDQTDVKVRGWVGLADATFYPVSHVGFAVVGRYIALARYQGHRLAVPSLTAALRVR